MQTENAVSDLSCQKHIFSTQWIVVPFQLNTFFAECRCPDGTKLNNCVARF